MCEVAVQAADEWEERDDEEEGEAWHWRGLTAWLQLCRLDVNTD